MFSWKSTKYKNCSLADGNGMSISTFCHLSFIDDFIILRSINPSIFLWRRASTGNQNFGWTKCNGSRTLKELMWCIIGKLFNCPFIFVDIITKTDLRINIITKQIDIGLILWSTVEWRELEKSFFNWTIIVYMNGILEHVVNEIWIRLNKIIKSWQNFKVLSLFFME